MAPAIGDSNVGLLANHGVVVLGRDIEQAYLRAMSFEWRCRQAWHIAAAGGGVPMDRDAPLWGMCLPPVPICSNRDRQRSAKHLRLGCVRCGEGVGGLRPCWSVGLLPVAGSYVQVAHGPTPPTFSIVM